MSSPSEPNSAAMVFRRYEHHELEDLLLASVEMGGVSTRKKLSGKTNE